MNSSNRRFDGKSDDDPSACFATASIVAVPLFVVFAALYPGGGSRISAAGIDEAGTVRIRDKRCSVARMTVGCQRCYKEQGSQLHFTQNVHWKRIFTSETARSSLTID